MAIDVKRLRPNSRAVQAQNALQTNGVENGIQTDGGRYQMEHAPGIVQGRFQTMTPAQTAATQKNTQAPQQTSVIDQSAYNRLIKAGKTPEEANKIIAEQKSAVKDTLSNTGRSQNAQYDPAVYARGSRATLFGLNNPGAKIDAAINDKREADIANIKKTRTEVHYDSDGNPHTVEVIDPEATKNAQDAARKANEMADAAAKSAAEQNMNSNPTTTGDIPSATSTQTNTTQGTDTTTADMQAQVDASNTDTQNILTQANKIAQDTFASEKTQADTYNEFYQQEQDRLNAEAQALEEQQTRENDLAKRQADAQFEQAIRDQEIKNEQDRQDWLDSSGISGAWKSSRHSADVIRALKAGDNTLADLKTNRAFAGEFYNNKLMDIETQYNETRKQNASSYKAASLQLLDNVRKAGNDLIATIFNSASDAVKQKNALREKMVEQLGSLAEKRAQLEYDTNKDLQTSTRQAESDTRQAINQVLDDEMKFAGIFGDSNPVGWEAIQARKRKLGLTTYPSVPTLAELDKQSKDADANYFASLPGKYTSPDGKIDYGLLLARSAQDLDKSKRYDVTKLTEGLLLHQNLDKAKENILTNVYDSFDTKQRTAKDAQDAVLYSMSYIDGITSGLDSNYGGLWKQLTEQGKPIFTPAGDIAPWVLRDQKFVKLKASIQEMQGVLQHERFGSALTSTEIGRSNDYLIDFGSDTAATITTKLNSLKAATLRSRAIIYDNRLGKGSYEILSGEKIPWTYKDESLDEGAALDRGNSLWNGGSLGGGSSGSSSSPGGAAFNFPQSAGGDVGTPSFSTSSPLVSYVKDNGFRITQYYNGTYDQTHGKEIAGVQNIFSDGRRNHASYNISPPKSGMTNVPAPAFKGGTVVQVQNSNKGYGNSIRIRDADGNTWIYGHLDKINVKKGQQIAQGLPVGTMGKSGWATGITLHLEARDKNNKPFDFALS